MEKQQTLRPDVAGAASSRADHQAQKSLAAQPRPGAPHRILELRNQITAGGARSAPSTPPANAPDAPARADDASRSRDR